MDKSPTRYNVQLYIYDLSRGMARSLSPIMLGKEPADKQWVMRSGLGAQISDDNRLEKPVFFDACSKQVLPFAVLGSG